MAASLTCENLCKSFDEPVLRGVSLEVGQGECVALLGPSGCGKSTLLNIVAGLLAPDAGQVRFAGETLDDPAAGVRVAIQRRRFAMVFQDFSLWPHLDAAANVAFGLRMLKVPAAQRRRRVEEALRRVRMEAFASRMPAALSGGQQQRVAIARAIAVEPRMLLLDEPLSALDATLREELRDELASLVRELGMTAILVTHDQSEALSIADRVAVMHRGRIEQIDSPHALYRSPATLFAASFIGTSRLLPAIPCAGGAALPCGAVIPEEALESPARRGTAVIRREAVSSEPRPPQGVAAIPARVSRTVFMGDRHEALVTTAGGSELRTLSDGPLPAGSEVWLRFQPRSIRIVPEESP